MSGLASSGIARQVSIVVPTYNRTAYLRDAVDSVLAQTYQDWELILADDGSGVEMTSYLAGLSQTPRVKVLRLPHSGNPSVVRNAGIRAASGVFVAFLDSDDVWLPTKLERQITLHQSHPERRWSYVAMERIHADGTLMQGQPLFPTPDGAIFEQLLTLKADVSMSSVMAERALLEGIGCFVVQAPKESARSAPTIRTAISGPMPERPAMRLCSCWRVTPSAFAAALIETPSASISSPIISPGWGGFFIGMVWYP